MAHIDRQFRMPGEFLADLDADAAAAMITASADVVLMLDRDGVIRDLALASEDLADWGCPSWLGKRWLDTVTVESRSKVEALLDQTASNDGVRWRHVNHPMEGSDDLPLSYAVVKLKPRREGRSKAGGAHALAFGRDLRPQVALQQRLVAAQLSMERDYWRLRQVETRYRLLFQLATEPVLILEGSLDKVEEANPAAQQLFGERAARPGWSLQSSLDPRSVDTLRATLERLRTTGRTEPLTVLLAGQTEPLGVAATQFRQDNALYFLLRFMRPQDLAASPSGTPAPDAKAQLLQVLEGAPDAMVVTDDEGRILTANLAFQEMAQVGSEDQARGQLLDKWLGRSGVDLRVMLSNLRQHGTVRLFATQMRGELGTGTEVEVSAVAANVGEQRCLGFTIREMGRRLAVDGRGSKELPRSPGQMTELVGRMPLKDIVRETTDLIEQLCIEAALDLTGDNRASAAEMLGLSRQSLYTKLRRFGMGESTGDGEPQP